MQEICKGVRDSLHNLLCNTFTYSLIQVVPFNSVKAGDIGPWYVQFSNVFSPVLVSDIGCHE